MCDMWHMCCGSWQHSPLFSKYEIVLNDIFIMEDDHDIENTKGEELEGQ